MTGIFWKSMKFWAKKCITTSLLLKHTKKYSRFKTSYMSALLRFDVKSCLDRTDVGMFFNLKRLQFFMCLSERFVVVHFLFVVADTIRQPLHGNHSWPKVISKWLQVSRELICQSGLILSKRFLCRQKKQIFRD